MTLMRFICLAIVGLAASACATEPHALPRATAVPETVRVEMPVDPRDSGLNWSQIDLIATLASEYKARGHGPLVISYPQNAGNSEAAIAAIAEARTRLYDHGLNWQQIAGGAYEAGGRMEAPVLFSFNRYQAVAPQCDEGFPDFASQAGPGQIWAQFGCATEANLAAMVADPRDLITPRTMDGPDTGRRQTVLENYRTGSSTASEATGRDSGAVSDVVEN
jgi:pilus assembly protein CpaD